MCLFYNVSFKSVTFHDIYNYEYRYFGFSVLYVTSSTASKEVFWTQRTLKYLERIIEKVIIYS